MVALFLVAVMDGLIAVMRQSPNSIILMPGEAEEISGPLRGEVKELGEPQVQAGSHFVQLTFLEASKGFWLGGDMWRGMISVDPKASPGDYILRVHQARDASGKPTSVYVVKVLPDPVAVRKESKSMILRYGNISPWLAVLIVFPCVLLGFLSNYLLAHRREQLLIKIGKAEIYHVLRQEKGYQVTFGMGSEHGLQVGSPLTILDEVETPVFSGAVEKVFEKDAMITVPLDCPVRTGYLVRINGGLTPQVALIR